MFFYIMVAALALSLLIAFITSSEKRRDYSLFAFFVITCALLGFCSLGPFSGDYSPEINNTTYSRTLSLVPLNDNEPDKYLLVDNNGCTFKTVTINENGIQNEKVFTVYSDYVFIDSTSVEHFEASVAIYEPNATFWYPRLLFRKTDDSGSIHDFYRLNIPENSIVYKNPELNKWPNENIQ